MLAKAKVHLRSEGDDSDLIFSPIADYGQFNDKTGKDIAKGTVYIRFNSLISQAILARSWRQINYARIIGADIYLVRWLTKMLGLRFTYAAPNKSFNIRLSTIIESSGVSLCARLSDNLKQVQQALAAMTEVVARYTVTKDFMVHGTTGRGRVLADAKIVIRPTDTFTKEQIKTNVHEHSIDSAVITGTGRVALEPRREDYRRPSDYDQAKADYEAGTRLKLPST